MGDPKHLSKKFYGSMALKHKVYSQIDPLVTF